MWPEVPDELSARVVPSGQWSGERVPFNRHQRKRFLSAESVVIHLFSGPEQAWWRKRLETQARAVLCIDKMVDPSQDLLSDQLASFLAELRERGSVDVILGGPRCRTVSKLCFRQPGPPPLRARSGPERFALEALSDIHRDLAWNDAVLWMRKKTGAVLEGGRCSLRSSAFRKSGWTWEPLVMSDESPPPWVRTSGIYIVLKVYLIVDDLVIFSGCPAIWDKERPRVDHGRLGLRPSRLRSSRASSLNSRGTSPCKRGLISLQWRQR